MKIVNTPKQRAFFRHTSLNFLAIRQDACENLPCLAKNSLLLGISPIFKQALVSEMEEWEKAAKRREIEAYFFRRSGSLGGLAVRVLNSPAFFEAK